MADDNDSYRVGRGLPPLETRFKKGVSGNPSGRPKKSVSFKSDLAAELCKEIVVIEGGKHVRITKQRALIRTLTSAAIENDSRAMGALLGCLKLFGMGVDEPQAEEIDADDLEILKNHLDRQRANPSTNTEENES